MPIYTCRRFSGDYRDRQSAANEWGADVYVEQHFDGSEDEGVCRASAIVADNASAASIRMGDFYATTMSGACRHNQGVTHAAMVSKGMRTLARYLADNSGGRLSIGASREAVALVYKGSLPRLPSPSEVM